MKFAKVLKEEAVLEWTTQYVDYKGLKGKLKAVKKSKFHEKENENNSSAATLRNSNEIQENDKNVHDVSASSHVRMLKRSSITSAASATSATSFLNKVSTKLSNLRGNGANFNSSKHKPQPPPTTLTSLEELYDQSNTAERTFFLALNQELNKVSLFYDGKEKEVLKRFESIRQQYKTLEQSKSEKKSRKRKSWKTKDTNINDKNKRNSDFPQLPKDLSYSEAKKRIKKALFELYRNVELLKNYQKLNRTAIIKILKQFDKIRNVNACKLYLQKIKSQNFMNSNNLDKIVREAEDFYTKHFEEGSRRRAMKKLRFSNKTDDDTHYSSAWRVGLYLGMALPFFLYVIGVGITKIQPLYIQHINNNVTLIPNTTLREFVDDDRNFFHIYSEDGVGLVGLAINDNTDTLNNIIEVKDYMSSLFKLYSAIGLVISLFLLLGVNMYVWNQSRINYKLIFGLNPRDNIDYKQYMEMPSLVFLIFCVTMYLNFGNLFYMKATAYPLVLLGLIIFIVIMPIDIFYYNARKWFVLTLIRIFGSPFTSVKFREFFIADVLTSLSYFLTNLTILTCTKSDCTSTLKNTYWVPILSSIPPVLRALQCTRRFYDTQKSVHLKNCAKYMSIVISIFMLDIYRKHGDIYRYLWIISQSISSAYTSYWDVIMDWFLFQSDSSNLFLREHLAYKKKWVYYFAIITNFMLRWDWLLLLKYHNSSDSIAIFFIAFGEMLRRWQWSFIRVEHEHILNCRDFRAINDVLLPYKNPSEEDIIGNDLNSVLVDDRKDIQDGETTQIPKSFKNNLKNFFTQMRNSRYVESAYDYEVPTNTHQYTVYEYDEEEEEEEEGHESSEEDYDGEYEEEYEEEEYENDGDIYYEQEEDGVTKVFIIDGNYPDYPRIRRNNIVSYASRSLPMFMPERN